MFLHGKPSRTEREKPWRASPPSTRKRTWRRKIRKSTTPSHIVHGQKAGIPMGTIRAVHQKKGSESFSSEDAQIVSFVREMIHSHRVSEPTFQAIYGRFGEKGMVELTATIGYYAMLACTLNTFDVYTFTPPDDLRI